MNLIESLHIQTVTKTPEKVVLQMPVTAEVKQPFGLVHGGINAVLAETAASIGANLTLDTEHVAVGLQINTNHLRSVQTGILYVQAVPVKIGHQVQVWQATTYQVDVTKATSFSTVNLKIQKISS
ncbi:PaaI family thioesterase [Bombilactobacillus thymidiniphilus]|uniref:PaaI family thioesterase n=1 Tax=Bombilactobacillus thymidiniphilus TaxID=2923363 RepID=A0ABY4PBY1_9LACO|nr:PaaI family thioesterase [Bombilactobacillus thymidiniphilus]UQS83125.1 PaaI family thioesterase [Bombilactobacillus thymidiniphilus]